MLTARVHSRACYVSIYVLCVRNDIFDPSSVVSFQPSTCTLPVHAPANTAEGEAEGEAEADKDDDERMVTSYLTGVRLTSADVEKGVESYLLKAHAHEPRKESEQEGRLLLQQEFAIAIPICQEFTIKEEQRLGL